MVYLDLLSLVGVGPVTVMHHVQQAVSFSQLDL